MEQGYVYVLVNSSMLGVVKVGCTTRTSQERAAELSCPTGVATPFIVAYEQQFEDCRAAEQMVHAELDRHGWRIAANREFFNGPPSEIIRIVAETAARPDMPDGGTDKQRLAETIPSLLQAGEKALLGLDDALQDTVEAIRCYKLARSRGSAAACERLGSIFLQLYAARGGKVYRRRAMEFFKEGVKRGNAHCYGGLSELFALEGHRDNFQKAWRLFFDGTAKDEDASAPDVCFVAACCRYIGLSLSMSIQPLNLIILRGASAAILSRLLSERDRLAPDDAQRAPLTDALRWTYAVLMPNAPLLSDLRAELQLKKSWRWRRPWQGLALPAA